MMKSIKASALSSSFPQMTLLLDVPIIPITDFHLLDYDGYVSLFNIKDSETDCYQRRLHQTAVINIDLYKQNKLSVLTR